MTLRHVLMALALVGAGWLALYGDKGGSADLADAVVRVAAPARAGAPSVPTAALAAAPFIARLTPRADLMGDADEAHEPEPDAVFASQSWNPPPPKQAPPSAPPPPPPPPPPTAPPLPFVVIGKAVADGRREVFLTRGERSYIAREHDVIDGIYRVDTITPPLMSITYLPLNQIQQLSIGEFD